jgi:hypothetical protein
MPAESEKPFYFSKASAEEVVTSLLTNIETGLTAGEIESRVRHHGYNEVPERKWMLDAIIAAIIASLGVFCMKPIPLKTTLIVVGYSFFFSLFINNMVKYIHVRRRGVRW